MEAMRGPIATDRIAAAAVGALLAAGAALAAADEDAFVDRVRRDAARLAGCGSRVVGSAGHEQALADLLAEVRRLSGVRVWSQPFPVVVPEVCREAGRRQAVLTVLDAPAGAAHAVYPIWPASVRPSTTPAEGIAGRLVYVGRARPAELRPRTLRGQIAVMEMTGGHHWQDAFNAGARAVVLLGSDDVDSTHARSHLTEAPINAPRFYVPAGPSADAIRRADGARASLFARCRWRQVQAANTWVLVRPAAPARAQRALAIAAPLDSMSVVLDLAPGADDAVDAALVLNLVRDYAAAPPARPLVFVFLDAQAIRMRGVREFLSALSLTADDKSLRSFRAEDAALVRTYEEHEALARRLDARPSPLAELPGDAYAPLHRYAKDEVAREVVAIETQMHPKRLQLYEIDGEQARRLRRQVDAMAARRAEFFAAQRCLIARPAGPGPVRTLAETLWQRARRRVRRQLAEARQGLQACEARRRLREELLAELGIADRAAQPLEFLLGLDLSDGGLAAGPQPFCCFWARDESHNAVPFTRWLSAVAREEGDALWPGELRRAVELGPLGGVEARQSFVAGETATLTSPASGFGLKAVTWATLDATRPRADTPQDRAERLDWSRLAPQVEATRRLIARLVSDRDFAVDSPPTPKWNRVTGKVVDTSPGEPVPQLPMEGYLTTLVHGAVQGSFAKVQYMPVVPGLRRQEFVLTGVDGRFRFDHLVVPDKAWQAKLFVQSWRLGDDGAIVRSLDLCKSGRTVRMNANVITSNLQPLRAVAFTCGEVTALQLFDPRFLLNLPAGTVFDANRVGQPQRMGFTLYSGQMACQLEPATRWYAVLRSGITRNRMALLNLADAGDPAGAGGERRAIRGFRVGEVLPMAPDRLSAVDLYRLDRRRLRAYRDAGIVSEPVEALQRRTEDLLRQVRQAEADDDGAGLSRAAAGALANEIRVYQAVRDTADDVIRGAIFLLLALVPFSFAMERLLFSTPYIYRQIAGTLGIFAAMAGVLWSFHPAFEISGQPMVIIMAFGIIAMSLLVISMIYSKFEAGLAEARSGRAESSAARTARAGVLITAIRLGIANMRKRKLRTALTGITVVLITFSLLCFMSTSSYTGHRDYRLNAAAPYTGVLIRQPSLRPMSAAVRTYLANILGQERTIAARFWWCDPTEDNWRIHVRNARTGKQVSLKAALGVSATDGPADGPGRLLGLARFCPNWDRFAATADADNPPQRYGCYLADSVAEELGLKQPNEEPPPGGRVVLAGRELDVIGVYDSVALDREAADLDGLSPMPMDYGRLSPDQRNRARDMTLSVITSELEAGAALTGREDLPACSSAAVILVPEGALQGLRQASLRSVAVATADGKEARTLAMELTRRLAFPIYYADGAGVRVVASAPMLPTAPKSLLIPLLIGGLMVFNTLLSSIAERRREIYIYTSLGLAPIHVAALFLAEALTYGLMGSVFGYVAGQGAATALGGLGLMGSLTLNYSGTQAVTVMVMVLAVVVLSSLVPAYLAGRIAVPASQMRWQVPPPVGETIRDCLPFTVTARTAGGVLMFLHEYIDAHREGNIGHFSSDALRAFRAAGGCGAGSVGLDATVWLAPYDLGVRQEVRLAIRPTADEDVYEIHVQLTRQAGQTRNWHSLNRTFLGDLRRQLLGWRKLKTDRVLRYIRQGDAMMAQTPAPAGDGPG